MANRLKMAKVNAVLRLHSQGWSHRRIAAHLGIHRETVSRYLAGFSADTDVAADESENSKPAKAPTGGPLPEPATSAPRVGDSKPAKAPLGSERAGETSAAAAEGGSRSGCARYREKIEAKLEAGLSAQRIFQDLREETGFTGSYYSVRRYVQKLGQRRSLPFRRLEQPPGEEERQADLGVAVAEDADIGEQARPVDLFQDGIDPLLGERLPRRDRDQVLDVRPGRSAGDADLDGDDKDVGRSGGPRLCLGLLFRRTRLGIKIADERAGEKEHG